MHGWRKCFGGIFSKSRNSKRDTGRSGLVRSALEKLSLFSPTCSVRQEHGAGSFAVCGRRLRGHVPSKNTSPTALSWISLIWDSFFQSFCFRTMIFVFGASDIDTTIFFPVPYFHRFFHGKSIAIFPKACYTILNFKRALFGTGTEVFYEALRGHLALGTGACRGAGR